MVCLSVCLSPTMWLGTSCFPGPAAWSRGVPIGLSSWPTAATWGTLQSLPGTGCSWVPQSTARHYFRELQQGLGTCSVVPRPPLWVWSRDRLQPFGDPHLTFTLTNLTANRYLIPQENLLHTHTPPQNRLSEKKLGRHHQSGNKRGR